MTYFRKTLLTLYLFFSKYGHGILYATFLE